MSEPVVARSWSSSGADDVCICGIGARTALGFNAPSTSAAVRSGISAATLHPSYLDRDEEAMSVARDATLDDEPGVEDRMLALLGSAILEAVPPAALSASDRWGYWLGVPEPRAGLHPSRIEALTRDKSIAGWSPPSVRMLAHGHAGGLIAMQAAAEQVAARKVDFAIAAGVDSYLDPITLQWLDTRGRLMSRRNRNGFIPGEGAGACLIVSRSTADRLDLPVLAVLRAASTAVEPHPLRSDGPSTGSGLSAAIGAVTSNLRTPDELIATTYCDLNGERHRSQEFLFAQLRTQQSFVDTNDYLSPADCWGDVGAASGPLYACLAVSAHVRGYARGQRTLLWAGSDRGHRSAVLLETPQRT